MLKAWLPFFFILSAKVFCQSDVELVQNANAVIIYDRTSLEVTSSSNYSVDHEYAVKLLNRYATSEKELYFHYDDFSTIKKVLIEVLDNNYQLIETFKVKDLNDISTGSGVASDSRAKYLKIVTNKYPIIIKVSSVTEHTGSLHFPIWDPQSNENLAVISGTFQIVNHTNNPVRYFGRNVGEPRIIDGEPRVVKWEIDSIRPYRYESFSNYETLPKPIIYTAPSEFIISDIEGNMSSWNEFGQFINRINTGKNNLTPEQKQEIRNLIDEGDTQLEKTRKVYSYLQEKMRYVSIQLGLGGWAPFDASFVHSKLYGDCKALSFYTKSALEEVGINSYYTLIRARPFAAPIPSSFPNAHFNHAILTVPMESDTLWLECTSQTSPFGYMGTFTGNRKALIITDNGAQLINTKHYSAKENEQISSVELKLTEEGTTQVKLNRSFIGLEIENDDFNDLLNESNSEAEKWFYDNLNIGDFLIEQFTIHPISQNTIPKTGYNIELILKNGVTKNGNRLFIRPAIFTNIDYYKLSSEERITDIHVRYGYTQIDTVNIELPKYFSPESIINPTHLETRFGSYQVEISSTENGIMYFRKFVLNDGQYSKESYPEFFDFIKTIQKYDRLKIVLLDKT